MVPSELKYGEAAADDCMLGSGVGIDGSLAGPIVPQHTLVGMLLLEGVLALELHVREWMFSPF